MRLDLLLKQTGLIKRRVVAKSLAENGKVYVNDKVVKPSFDVKENDKLYIVMGNKAVETVVHFNFKNGKEIPFCDELVLTKLYVEN